MQDDEQSVRQFVSTWVAAAEGSNGDLVLSLIAEDAVFLTPGQPPMSKSDFAEAQSGLKEMRLQISSELQDVKVSGEWAYCWNKLTVVATPREGGTSVKRSGNTLSVLKKHQGSWLIVRDANMLTVAS